MRPIARIASSCWHQPRPEVVSRLRGQREGSAKQIQRNRKSMKRNCYVFSLLAFSSLGILNRSIAAELVVTGDSLNIGSSHTLRSAGPTQNSIAGGALNT